MALSVCAIQHLTDTEIDKPTFENAIPIAGEFSHTTGGALDPKWSRMQDSPSSVDHEREGIILELNGGKDPSENIRQKAIIEFICSAEENSDVRRRDGISNRADEKKDDDEDDTDDDKDEGDKSAEETSDEHGGKLKYYSWEMEGDMKVLRLQWFTKYACEDVKDPDDKSGSGRWGFFTWLIIV